VSTSPATLTDAERWNAALVRLRERGFTPAESVKITMAVLDIGLSEADEILCTSAAWADQQANWTVTRESFWRSLEALGRRCAVDDPGSEDVGGG